MMINIPVQFDDIVDEIVKFTDIPLEEVKYRLWMEALQNGWNVKEDINNYDVTPHVYNDKMMRLYQRTYGFIFENMAFWAQAYRREWVYSALERILKYVKKHNLSKSNIRILIFGDGVGNDSLYLIKHGFFINYFDIPESITFNYALKRFYYYDVINKCITVVPDYNELPKEHYDIIICFEVLEHLLDPISFIKDISKFLKVNGIALITESFHYLNPFTPTHLDSNVAYAGRTPFLFADQGLSLTWYSMKNIFKPYEFIKENKNQGQIFHKLLKDRNIVKSMFYGIGINLLRKYQIIRGLR